MLMTGSTDRRRDDGTSTEVWGWDLTGVSMSPGTEVFFRYCRDLKGDRDAPRVRDFDITVVAARDSDVVRHIWVLDADRDPRRFRYRLIGCAIKEAGGLARVGDDVAQFDETGRFTAILAEIADRRLPRFYSGPPLLVHDTTVRTLEIVQVPFADDSGTISRIYNCTFYTWQPGYAPQPRL